MMKPTRTDIISLCATLAVLAVSFFAFNSTSNEAGKAWDIQYGYWFILGVFLVGVGAFAWNAKELWTRFKTSPLPKGPLLSVVAVVLGLTIFITSNIHIQHRVLSDENSWTSMAMQMRFNQSGGVCNQGFWIDGRLNCTDVVTNFKGKSLALLQSLQFLALPANRDTALASSLPLYILSLLLFFFALQKLHANGWLALAATTFLGATPILLMQSRSASTEVLYIFLLSSLLFLYAYIPPKEVKWKHLFLIIPILGLFSGTRQETVFCFIPFALFYFEFFRRKPWHLPAFTFSVVLASWPAINTMAAYRGYDFQGGQHAPHSLGNLWFNLQSNISIMMKPGSEVLPGHIASILKNPFYSSFTAIWLAATVWLIIRMVVSRKYLWGGILLGLFHLQSLIILINVSGTFDIDINQRYVLIALPSFAWIMALGLYDFLQSVPAEQNMLRRFALPITLAIALVLSFSLTLKNQQSFQSNMLYYKNKLLAEEDVLNTELKKLPPNSIFIYSRPWQMICSGFNAFSENTLLGWSDQEYAKWRAFSGGNIYLVRGQDGYGSVDKGSRVVGFKTTDPIERIMSEYSTLKLWSNSKDFGYPLTVTQINNRKGRSQYAQGLIVEPSAIEIQKGNPFTLTIRRTFPDALPLKLSLDGAPLDSLSLKDSTTNLSVPAAKLAPGLHSFVLEFHAPEADTIRISQDVFVHGSNNALLQSLPFLRQTQAWSTPQIGKTVEGNSIKIDRRIFAFGIGSHANSSLSFRINGQYQRFHSVIGLDDEAACGDGAQWIVRGDQRVLWTSEVLTAQMADTVSVDVSGVQVLELETKEGANNFCDHADWAGAWLE